VLIVGWSAGGFLRIRNIAGNIGQPAPDSESSDARRKACHAAANRALASTRVGARPSVFTRPRAFPMTVIDQNQASSGREAVRSS
jgi:hypothetical protein